MRLSRPARLARWMLPFAVALFLAIETFCIYIFVLDVRMMRALGSRSWRRPTILATDAGGRTREFARVYGVDWRVTPPVLIETLPPHVADAFLAAEDVRFRHHIGVDPVGIARALLTNVRAGGIAQGGSTITQQIVKQRFLTQERTWSRKIVEGILAVVLDARLSKDDILELYLNDVYLGHHAGAAILGIDEASRLYFDKPPRLLRVDEAALLAGMIRAPNRDNPEKRPDLVRARRDAILGVMRDHHWIDDAEYRAAVAQQADVSRGALPETPYPYYLRALRTEFVRELGERVLAEGGLTIVCELDPAAQRAAEREAQRGVARLEARYSWIRQQSRTDPLQVAILTVDPRNGGVRALVGGADFHRSPFDRTWQMRRQPGSAFKSFAYLAAIASKRATPATLLLDAPLRVELSSDEVWEPQNYDQNYRGRVTLRESFERSLNVPTVRLTEQIGLRRVVGAAKDFGFQDIQSIPALPLGVVEVTMRELTAAYTAFPNLGQRVEPFLLQRVANRNGKVLYEHELKSKRVVDAAPAYVLHTLLRGVVRRGTATRLRRYGLGYVAGKTGTTNDYRDAWFVGYTADAVSTVWVGYDRGAPLRLSSSEAAIPIWGAYMSATPHQPSNPKPPAGVTFRDIDPESGMLWQDGCPGPIREVFLDGTAPTRRCPRGIFGRIVRRVLFDEDHFDEPPAITFEQFRRWANEVDRNRQDVEGALDKLRRWFH
ncbi:MAG: PBP1A family penicillin-binding protein [Acidobacteria bacterium]|nr:PBP1A family penicillin-binding protein [Acidobacteriota bacterium]MBV9477286.1 PBP1A family penicillin-binding protein [Acidobacteriota bacterium]